MGGTVNRSAPGGMLGPLLPWAFKRVAAFRALISAAGSM